jgi:GNAT superfamily N-acetyltransferase
MNVMNPRMLTEPASRVMLGNSRWVTIRAIELHDADGLSSFYERLSPDARRLRFLSACRGIEAKAAHHFAEVDHVAEEGFVAVLHEAGPEDGVIVGHLCLEPVDGGEELAVAVADGFRGRGIGTVLIAAAVAWARRRGAHCLSAVMYPTNTAMRRLLLETGLSVASDRIQGGVEDIQLVV